MGLIMDRESLLLPPNASLIVREVPWLIITYRAAENEMIRSGDRCEDWWPTLQRTQAPAIYCQVLNSMVFPPHFWLRCQHWVLEEGHPCHFTAICWKRSATLATTDSNGILRFSALSRLHPIPRELWTLPTEVTESNFNERPCSEERKEKNHLRITFRLKTEWSFCKLIPQGGFILWVGKARFEFCSDIAVSDGLQGC